MRLDRRDLRILTVLQADGRITQQALAERVALSPSACHERLRRLEAAGLIGRYRAEVALERLIRAPLVFVEITLERHAAEDFRRFERAVQDIPEVVECHALGGGLDYLLKIAAADLAHYQELIDGLLAADLGIDRYFTYAVTKPVKPFAGYPLERLLARAGTLPES